MVSKRLVPERKGGLSNEHGRVYSFCRSDSSTFHCLSIRVGASSQQEREDDGRESEPSRDKAASKQALTDYVPSLRKEVVSNGEHTMVGAISGCCCGYRSGSHRISCRR